MTSSSLHENVSSTLPPAGTGPRGNPEDRVDAPTQDLFPLTPTPFERYMLVEDRPAYSMSFVVVCELDGRADETALRQAIATALLRHPMLTARLAGNRLRPNWNSSPTPAQIVWHESETGWAPAEPPDLARVGGVRMHVFRGSHQTSLHFRFHHAVTDGIGAFQFVGDILAVYGQQTATGEERPRLLPTDIDYLKQRETFDIRIPHPVSRAVAWRALLTESWRVISRRPCVLRAPKSLPERSSGAEAENLSADPRFALTGKALSDYTDVATAREVTVNDLLLRDVFLTMRQWNASLGASRGRDWLRVTVPTSLRYRNALRMPAANMIGYAFLTHRAAECDDPSALLALLSGEMKAITQWGLGAFFVRSLDYADRVPGLLWAGSRLSRRFSTLVFSNLGDVARRFRARFPTVDGRLVAGNLVMRNLYGAPPVRPGTRIAFGVFNYDGKLTFVTRYDRRHFCQASATDFLEMYREQLAHTAKSGRDVPY